MFRFSWWPGWNVSKLHRISELYYQWEDLRSLAAYEALWLSRRQQLYESWPWCRYWSLVFLLRLWKWLGKVPCPKLWRASLPGMVRIGFEPVGSFFFSKYNRKRNVGLVAWEVIWVVWIIQRVEYHVKSGMMNRHQVQLKNQKAKELKQTFVQKLAMEKHGVIRIVVLS